MNPNLETNAVPPAAAMPHGRHMNALKHGMRSKSVLLPGDDVTEFRRMREKLFRIHEPLTGEEAYCVEMIAKMQWNVERALRWQEVYNAQQDALLEGDPGLGGPLCEPDPHRSLHRPMDCQLHIDRMDRTLSRNRAQLRDLQKQRHQGLLPGKEAIAGSYLVFLEGGIAEMPNVRVGRASLPGQAEQEPSKTVPPDRTNQEEAGASVVVGRASPPGREHLEEPSTSGPVGRASLPDPVGLEGPSTTAPVGRASLPDQENAAPAATAAATHSPDGAIQKNSKGEHRPMNAPHPEGSTGGDGHLPRHTVSAPQADFMVGTAGDVAH